MRNSLHEVDYLPWVRSVEGSCRLRSPLLAELRRSPIDASDLDGFEEETRLGLEIGLLQTYEGADDTAVRYRVPDLYRMGIGVTRRGPG
jgi:hypothetical protein